MAFLLFAVVAAVTPGPSNIMLTAAGANAGVLKWKIATSGRRESAAEREPVGYVGAAVFQWINPKSWLVSTSAAGTFLHPEAGSAMSQSASLGGLFVLAALPSGFVWLAFGATLQHALHDERRRRIFNIVMGTLLALSVALIVW